MNPESAEAALKLWDAGEPVPTVEMGGIGPGYEQAIQILVFETLREALTYAPSEGWRAVDKILEGEENSRRELHQEFNAAAERAIKRTDANVGGYSGAQVRGAKGLAWQFLTKGWEATFKEVEEDRRILVSKKFPRVE